LRSAASEYPQEHYFSETNGISFSDLDSFLRTRKGIVQAVAITGGEPCFYPRIHELISLLRMHNLRIKIDTNGLHPDVLRTLNCDYIAMDIKTDPEKYGLLGGNNADCGTRVKKSIEYVRTSGIAHEFRTTIVPGIVDLKDILTIAELVHSCSNWYLQQFNPKTTLDKKYMDYKPYSLSEMRNFQYAAQKIAPNCRLRN